MPEAGRLHARVAEVDLRPLPRRRRRGQRRFAPASPRPRSRSPGARSRSWPRGARLRARVLLRPRASCACRLRPIAPWLAPVGPRRGCGRSCTGAGPCWTECALAVVDGLEEPLDARPYLDLRRPAGLADGFDVDGHVTSGPRRHLHLHGLGGGGFLLGHRRGRRQEGSREWTARNVVFMISPAGRRAPISSVRPVRRTPRRRSPHDQRAPLVELDLRAGEKSPASPLPARRPGRSPPPRRIPALSVGLASGAPPPMGTRAGRGQRHELSVADGQRARETGEAS
jgi:hypothetical protein